MLDYYLTFAIKLIIQSIIYGVIARVAWSFGWVVFKFVIFLLFLFLIFQLFF